jgi:hypothetical protein
MTTRLGLLVSERRQKRVSSLSTSSAAPLPPGLWGAPQGAAAPHWVRACTPQGRQVRRWVALLCSGGRALEVPAEMPFEIPIRLCCLGTVRLEWADPLMARRCSNCEPQSIGNLDPLAKPKLELLRGHR